MMKGFFSKAGILAVASTIRISVLLLTSSGELHSHREAGSPGSVLLQLKQQRNSLQRIQLLSGGDNHSHMKVSLSQTESSHWHRANHSQAHLMCSKYWRGASKKRECALGCMVPEVALGAVSNGGKELQNGACMHFASKPSDGLRYCGDGPEYMEGDSLDCRGCSSCPSGCQAPEVFLGQMTNGGKDLDNGACNFFASKPIDGSRYCGDGPDYVEGDSLDCRGCGGGSIVSSVSKSFHDIVGGDGVYMLSMNCRTERFQYSAQRLGQVGITPTFFAATETIAPADQLAQGCFARDGQCSGSGKVGEGCVSSLEQAIADSHRRALEVAQSRGAEWTAILEDDAVPAVLEDSQWTERLMQVWAEIPAEIDVVRLGWCAERDPTHRWEADPGSFVLADTPIWAEDASWAGGCTHAYAVRRTSIPKMLGLFPCCCAVDCCFAWGMPGQGISMVNIDAVGSKEWIASRGEWKQGEDWGSAYGVMMQAKNELPSVRTE